jgi:transposase
MDGARWSRQQAVLAVHRLREGYKEERTGCINRIRGLLAEFGLVFLLSPEALRLQLADVIEDASNELPHLARVALQRAQLQWIELECHLAWCDERIAAHVKTDEQARTASTLMGIGPVTASALAASVGDFRPFRHRAPVVVATLGDASEAGLAAAGVLAGHQTEPGAELRAGPDPGRAVGRDDGAPTS